MKKKYNSPKIEIIDITSEKDLAFQTYSNGHDINPNSEVQSRNSGMQNPFDNSLSPIYGDQD